jgi:hypothetical protein
MNAAYAGTVNTIDEITEEESGRENNRKRM